MVATCFMAVDLVEAEAHQVAVAVDHQFHPAVVQAALMVPLLAVEDMAFLADPEDLVQEEADHQEEDHLAAVAQGVSGHQALKD